MPVNTYECMFLLDPNRVSSDVQAAAQQLHAVFERHQAELLASRQWDERRLAYPVKGHKKGLYYLTYFRTEGKNVVNIEHDLALNEKIMVWLSPRRHSRLRRYVVREGSKTDGASKALFWAKCALDKYSSDY